MTKKIISCIFIYILLTGCDTLTGPENGGETYYLDINAPNLVTDYNGFYIMPHMSSEYQTVTTLKAETGSIDEYQHLQWLSDKEFGVEWQGQWVWANLVNSSSYTNDEGVGHTVLGVYDNFVGDTIKVYCGYQDNYGNHYLDSLEVIVQ